MKNLVWIVLFAMAPMIALSQGEGVEPMAGNPQLQAKTVHRLQKANPGTFDSTFIYTSDTIDLPVFDEFSKSKFQTYNADYSDLGVTFDKVYRLLDMSDNPLPVGENYTLQPTYRLVVDLGNSQNTQDFFTPTQIKIADLSSYPVSYVTTDVYPPYVIYDTLDFPNLEDTIFIFEPDVYQDSATQFFAPINDPELIWLDDQAYHNYSMALDPWSLGVVTFDGLDENGYPYSIGSTITNYADALTSKPIDMAAVAPSDSVYFSFLFQKEGLCDPPEASDSLVLEFYAKDLDQWNRIWSANGGTVDEFEVVHLKIDDTDYFKKGFQFRFRNYGGLSGSLDHFHIDYVNLRSAISGSGYQDTVIRDFAMVYPVYTILDSYTSVPWDHYKNNPTSKIASDVKVVVRNSDNIDKNEMDGSTVIEYGGLPEGNFVIDEADLTNGDLNYLAMKTYHTYHDFSTSGVRFDETKTGLIEEFDLVTGVSTQSPVFTQNDTSVTTTYFQNYYAYDDGTAEQAYGPTGPQSMLAIRYTPYESDSLIGAKIHFVPTVNDVSNNLFALTVWEDNNGTPGDILYEDPAFALRQPEYEYDRNIFSTYYFVDTMKVEVTGSFFIGWRQIEAERLGVGLDRNIVNNDKTFYSTDFGNSWEQSAIEGSVMIRPVFSTAFDVELGIEEAPKDVSHVRIYPNPTNDIVQIRVENGEYNGVQVMNLQGQVIVQTSDQYVDLSSYPKGMYFFRLEGQSEVYKIIKQ